MTSFAWPKYALSHNPVLNVLVLAVIFNFFCAALIIDDRQNALDQAKASSRNLVSAVARDISRTIEIIDLTLQKMTDRIQQPDFPDLGYALQRQLLIDQVATARYFAAIAITNESGTVAYHSRLFNPEAINVAKNAYFTEHRDRADTGLYVSLPLHSRAGFGWGLVFSRRLANPDGSFAGIAYVVLGLDYFTDLFKRMSLGQSGSMSLMRTDKKLLVREPFNEKHLGADVSQAEIYRYFPGETSGSFESKRSPFDGLARLYTFTQVGSFPITISVGRSLQDLYASWWRRALTIGGILVVLTGAMVALALDLRRELRRRRSAHQEALRNEALFRGAMRGAGIGTALLSLDGAVFNVNPAFCRLFGLTEAQALSKTAADLVHPDDTLPNDRALLRGETDFTENELRYRRNDGGIIRVLRSASLVRDEAGRGIYLIVQYQDVTARRAAEERLEHTAAHDELTGLFNRSSFEKKLHETL